jgi:hypothetical protein
MNRRLFMISVSILMFGGVPAVSQLSIFDKVSKYSYPLLSAQSDGLTTGTGFFYRKNKRIFLITAGHNFKHYYESDASLKYDTVYLVGYTLNGKEVRLPVFKEQLEGIHLFQDLGMYPIYV